MTEIWKDVPGYEGCYQVSNTGNVRSLTRQIELTRDGTHYKKTIAGRLLRPGRMTEGHLSVALGRGNSHCVHKLVLLAFVGPRPEGLECRHLNGVPADNRLENLRWGTRRENILDAVSHGTWMTPERHNALRKGRATRYGHE